MTSWSHLPLWFRRRFEWLHARRLALPRTALTKFAEQLDDQRKEAEAEAARLREELNDYAAVIRGVVTKLDAIHADPQYQSVWVLA